MDFLQPSCLATLVTAWQICHPEPTVKGLESQYEEVRRRLRRLSKTDQAISALEP